MIEHHVINCKLSTQNIRDSWTHSWSYPSIFCDHSSQLLTLQIFRCLNQSSTIICLKLSKQRKRILMMVQMVVWTFVTETEPSRQSPGWKTSTIGHPSLGFRQRGHRVAMNRVKASDRFVLPPTWNTITVLRLWSRHAVRPRAGASTSVLLPLATTKWTGILINASTGLNQGSSHSEFFWRINLLVDGADPLAEVKQATQHVRHSSAHSDPTFKISFWWIRLRFDQWSSCGTHHADLEVSFSSLKYQFVNSWTCSLRRNLISHWHQCAQQHVSLRWFLYSWWWIY